MLIYINVTNKKVEDIDIANNLVKEVENDLKSQKEVTEYTSATGSGIPLFYITLPTQNPSKDVIQIIVGINLNKTNKYDTKEKLAEYLQS